MHSHLVYSKTHPPAASAGELRHIQKLRFWPLGDVLHDKYLLPKEEADMIASFLNPMLRLIPEKRAKASELIHHAWLESVAVQGEIDIIRRAEEEDRRRKELAAGGSGKGKQIEDADAIVVPSQALDSDAMKPVEDVIIAPDDIPKISAPVPSSAAGKENSTKTAKRIPTLQNAPAPPKTTEHKR